ncbi:hypothetical protein DF020_28495 [Burkholderia cenocepacia]|nr:hypothetical protein DF020_28495 [Burkholderia cenocepacia]
MPPATRTLVRRIARPEHLGASAQSPPSPTRHRHRAASPSSATRFRPRPRRRKVAHACRIVPIRENTDPRTTGNP